MSQQQILDAYQARQDRELDDFVAQQAALLKTAPTATAPDAAATPPGATPAPVASGNVFSRAGSAIVQRYQEGRQSLTQGVEGAPDGSRGVVGRAWDATKGLATMAGAPFAGVGSVVGEGAAAAADYTGAMSDESLRARLANKNMEGFDDKALVQKLLGMTYEQRIEYVKNVGGTVGEVAAGFVSPAGVVKGVSRLVGVGGKVAEAGALAAEASTAGKVVEGATVAKKLVSGAENLADTPMPNVARMGVEDSAKNLILNINAKLAEEGKLARGVTQTHEMTVEAAKTSRFRNVETILAHDDAIPLAAHDLTAARAVRDASLTHADGLVSRFLAGEEVGEEMRAAILGTGQISRKVTNATTAGARTVESGNIVSDAALANKFNLENFGKQITLLADELPATNAELAAAFSKMATGAEKEQLAARVASQPGAFWQVYYGLNLLSGPATHLANIGGNVTGMAISLADRSFGSLAARPFRWAGAKGSHVAPGEAVEMARGWAEAIPDAFRAVKHAVATGESAYAAGKSEEMAMHLAAGIPSTAFNVAEDGNAVLKFFDMAATKTIRGLALDTMGQYVGRGLQSMDDFVKVLVHQGELRAQSLRIAYDEGKRGEALALRQAELMAKPNSIMEQAAVLAAKEGTFAKEFAPGGVGAAAQKVAGSTVARLTMTPFWRTPVRVAEFGMDHTPILNEIASTLRGDFAAGGHRAELAIGRSVTSLAVATASWQLASNGLITGAGPTDPKLRAHMTAAGWQPFSVYNPTNGKYYSMAPLMAVLPAIGAVATIAEMSPELKDHEWTTLMQAAVIAYGRAALDHPFWSGVSEALDGITELSSRGTLEKVEVFWQKRLVSVALPGGSALRSIVRATDSEQRDARPSGEDGEMQALLKRFQANIPGWANHLPARMNNITGEPILRAESAYGLSPVAVTTQTNDPVLLEIAALGGAGIPAEVPRVLGGSRPSSGPMDPSAREGVMLTDKERGRLTQLLTGKEIAPGGVKLRDQMDKLIGSAAYKRQSEETKGDLLREMYQTYMEAAEMKLRQETPELQQILIQREQQRILRKLPPQR